MKILVKPMSTFATLTAIHTWEHHAISCGSVSEQVLQQLNAKSSHILKFTLFLAQHGDAPFSVKKYVWNSVLQSACFYSWETCLARDHRITEAIYISTIKLLLGVSPTTCNDIAMVIAGVGDAKIYHVNRQCRFIRRLMARDRFHDTYVGSVFTMTIETWCPAALVLCKLQSMGPNYDYDA